MNRYQKFLFLLTCATPVLFASELLQLSNDNSIFIARSVSDDGNVVVGLDYMAESQEGCFFRWTRETGPVKFDARKSFPYAISADGKVVVGAVKNPDQPLSAFYWTQERELVFETFGGNGSTACGVSADGSVVVGGAENPDQHMRAFRWTQRTGLVELGTFGGNRSTAYGVSANGKVVVGFAENFEQHMHAFRWTQETGLVALETLGDRRSIAYGVSRDGTAVVGFVIIGDLKHAFLWTETGRQMEDLGTLNGFNGSIAYGTNVDGRVVVGTVTGEAGKSQGFRWTRVTGLQTIEEWLSANGVKTEEHITSVANAVNADGSVVVGRTIDDKAFIARVDSNGAGLIRVSDLLQNLANNNAVFSTALEGGSLVLHGLNGYPLAKIAPEPYDTSSWLAGDWRVMSDGGRGGLGEIGFAHRLSSRQHLTLSLGVIRNSQCLISGGKAIMQGPYVLTQLMTKLTSTSPLWATLGIFYHWSDAEIKRGYMNARAPDVSSGKTKARIPGLRIRLDAEAQQLGYLELSPYIELTTLHMRVNGYKESAGSFPVRFNKRKENSTQGRLGLHNKLPLKQNWYLTSQAEGVHVFQKKRSNMTGEVIGICPFDIPGQKLRNTSWLRGSLGINHEFKQSFFSLMAHGATKGQDPNFWLAVAYRVAF